MIAIVFLALAAPILALPVTEKVEHHQQEHQISQYTIQQQQQQQQFPSLAPGVYPVSEFVSPKGKSAVVQVPIEPDALVIPYPATRTPSTPYPVNQYTQYPTQYNQYPEPFLVVPIHNIQRVSPVNYTPYNYYQTPQLLYYLPKSYHNYYQQQQYQTQYQTQHPEQVHEQVQQQVAEKSVNPTGQVQQIVPQQEIVNTQQTVGQTVEGTYTQEVQN
ncbi:UNVERIFIED_CONTAM: hypothetical protein PYX00_008414 [Menopon gallinae]|uniref:Uncharacterized protein n=1 Tax=Menopon gallinae TaxID=328185 RepID=A0AAW2HNM6_9NEOP